MHISKRLERFPENIFSSLAKEVKKVEEKSGRKAFDLSVGSPDFPPSGIYIEKLKEYISEPKSHLYPGFGATPTFSDGLIDWYKKRFNVALSKEELFPLLGAKDGVAHIPMVLADEGDEILVPNPGYPAFTGPALMMGCVIVPYSLSEENDFKLSLSEIEKKITSKTRMVWVNFPSNPTGQVASLSEIEPLVALCKRKNIWLIYDNAYAEMTYDGYVAPSILQIPGAKDIAVEIGSFSKMYSFAGYRMGWIVGNAQVIAALAKVKSQLDSGMSRPLQQLAGYAFLHPDMAWHEKMITSYIERKNILLRSIQTIGLSAKDPKGALYLWARIPESASDSYSFAQELLQKKHIVVTPGIAFGSNGERFVRISFCSDITRIADYL